MNLLRDRSLNKIITGPRNSIKRQSRCRWCRVALYHSVVSRSNTGSVVCSYSRAPQKLGQETVRRCHHDGHARLLLRFFPSSLDLSVELLAAEVIASLDETFPHPFLPPSLSFSLLFPALLPGNAVKNISWKRGTEKREGQRDGAFSRYADNLEKERKKERKK